MIWNGRRENAEATGFSVFGRHLPVKGQRCLRHMAAFFCRLMAENISGERLLTNGWMHAILIKLF